MPTCLAHYDRCLIYNFICGIPLLLEDAVSVCTDATREHGMSGIGVAAYQDSAIASVYSPYKYS